MKLLKLLVTSIVLFSCIGDSTTSITHQDIGLPTSSMVPPKGIGVAPISGYPGPTPASIPTSSVGANAPGSLALYGGQWVIPLPVPPAGRIGNASCDLIPNSGSATTVELVGRDGTITSKVVGPATGVIVTLWLLPTDTDPAGYTVGDGENIVIRLSFRDSATGAWSSGAQQIPVIGCAVNVISNSRVQTMNVFIPPSLTTINAAVTPMNVAGGRPGPLAYSPAAGFPVGGGVSYPVIGIPVGSHIVAARAKITDDVSHPLSLTVWASTQPGLVGGSYVHVADIATSTGAPNPQGFPQTLTGPSFDYVLPNWTTPVVSFSAPSGASFAIIWMAEVDYIPPPLN